MSFVSTARTAPHLYLDLVPITLDVRRRFSGLAARERRSNGRCACANSIRRNSMTAWLSRGGSIRRCGRWQRRSPPFHALPTGALRPGKRFGRSTSVLADNDSVLAANARSLPAAGGGIALTQASRDALAALSPLLEARASGGYVRHCHGDLHLRNIVEIDGRARPVRRDRVRRFRSPRSTCSTISPSCSWISASAALALTRTRSSTPISTRRGALATCSVLPRFRFSCRCGQ